MEDRVIRRYAVAQSTNENVMAGKLALNKPIVTRRVALGVVNQNKVVPKKQTDEPIKKPVQAPKIAIPHLVGPKKVNLKENADKPKVETKVAVSYSTKSLTRVIDEQSTDPLSLPEYIDDIILYLLKLENVYQVTPNFLTGHKSTPHMRSVVVNWMCEVCINFKFLPETFHMSIGILDRYLQCDKTVDRGNLQLVSVSTLFIASKYEEMYVPEISDFEYVCDQSVTKKEIVDMEKDILKALGFCLSRPLSLHFLRRYSKLMKVTNLQHNFAKYLLELSLLEYELSHVGPSLQAAAAICLSMTTFNNSANNSPETIWNRQMVEYTTYKYEHIYDVIVDQAAAVIKSGTSKFQAIRKKYSTNKVSRISSHPLLKSTIIQKLASKSKLLKK